ncbi:hypothetical protein [Geminocystis sp. NIES-3709]|uniref:hypothetical protein n=1 Tax=Geminocystis sp. NIES-3709 TaxID=1617448 RepID=UPI0005FC3C3D|nr:hypothetical protein [Geminocystis sp. NIES-3709]BAQ63912.1 hypothetical protein GM3709_677 [Geminocystis sp. NIES-3709]
MMKKDLTPSQDLPTIPPALESLSSHGYSSMTQIELENNSKLLSHRKYDEKAQKYIYGKWLSVDGLKYFLDTWQKNREDYEKYNGWVILPKKYRDRLWNYTKEWIGLIFEQFNDLDAPSNLYLIYELNWRLEKILIPLTPLILVVNSSIEEKLTSIVEKFNPYPELINFDNSTQNQEKDNKNNQEIITPDNEKYQGKDWDWNKITNAWVDLAFGLLKNAREIQNKDDFELWRNRLKQIVSMDSVWHSRWIYEQCLYHLSRLEYDLVANLVEEWESNLNLIPDFWEVKRASILAQIGELKEAKKITEKILTKIRFSIQPYEINYSLLSQEGWTMLLNLEIKQQILFSQGKWEDIFEPDENRDRWETLNQYYCNPHIEIETLAQIVDRPPPQIRQQIEETRGFLPYEKFTTIRYGDDNSSLLSDLRPAFESIRILQEGGIPFSLNNIKGHQKHIINASKWTLTYLPEFSLLTLIQLDDQKKIKDWLSFVDIALLPQEYIDNLFELLYGFFYKVIEQLSNLRKNAIFTNEYLYSRLPVFTEVLSCLCIRLNNEQLKKVFNLAVKMYNIESFRQIYAVHNLPCLLFKHLFYVLLSSDIINKLNTLLSLPMVGETGFVCSHPNIFKEPFYYIEFPQDFTLDDNFDRTQWNEAIERLINVIQNDNGEARKRAISRLIQLYIIKGLTFEQENLFAKALYSQRENNLPKDIDKIYRPYIILSLPEEQQGIAKDVISQSIIKNLENIKNFRFNSNADFDQLNESLRNLFYASLPLNQKLEDNNKYINWTEDNIQYFFTIINDLWTDNKSVFIKIYSQKNHLFRNLLLDVITQIDNCLSRVILPRLKNSEDNLKIQIKELIDDCKNNKISMLSVFPIMLFIDENLDVNEIARKLIFALSSLDKNEINSAVNAIEIWLMFSHQEQIKHPPENLLNELISKVIYYREAKFSLAVYTLGNMISMLPNILTQSQLESILIGLEYLLEETQLPDNWTWWKIFNYDINRKIDVKDIPQYMEYCSYLANCLYKYYQEIKKEEFIPEILNKWKDNSLNSVFPRVRKIWKN